MLYKEGGIFMVKIEVAKAIDFNQLINSKEAEVVSMRILNQSNSYISLFSLAKNEEITAEAMLGNRYYYCFKAASAFNLADCVEYKDGQIVSKNLVAKSNLVITIMSFWKGEALDPHKAPGDALVTVLDGEGKYIVDGKPFIVKKGESAVLPANIPHAVEAVENFKMMLTLVK